MLTCTAKNSSYSRRHDKQINYLFRKVLAQALTPQLEQILVCLYVILAGLQANAVSLYPYPHVPLHPCILVTLYPCIIVHLYPSM